MDVEQLAREYLTESDFETKRDILGNIYRALDKLIIKLCNKYSAYAEYDDLRQETFFGVLKALEDWEPEKKTFLGYSRDHISWHLLRYISQSNDGSEIFREYQQYVKYEERYFQKYGRYPTAKNTALYFCVTPERVRDIKKRAQSIRNRVSIDDTLSDTDITYEETMADDTQDTEESALRECTREEIRLAVMRLPSDERAVIAKRFFQIDRENMTKEERLTQARAFRHLRNDKTIRSMAYEEIVVSKAYYWHNREESHTEWSAIKLAEYMEGISS